MGHLKPEEIMAEAIERYKPVAIFAGFSGGTDSLAVTHWVLSNYPQAKAFHANTGIGVEKTRQFVRDTCKQYGWDLVEIRAKEDCGQDYDELVREWGFPGPAHHRKMYSRLKERAVRELVKRQKTHWKDKVLICTGIRHDESRVRAGYAGREINTVGAQVWVNPVYWWTGSDKAEYIRANNLPTNPVSELLGMSGECLCGAFAHKGELDLVRLIDPEVAQRIDRLAEEARERGWSWGWEECPPKGGARALVDAEREEPMCVGCNKGRRELMSQIDMVDWLKETA